MSDPNQFAFNQSNNIRPGNAIEPLLGGRSVRDTQAQDIQNGASIMLQYNDNISHWQLCRVCQQSFFTTTQFLHEHELSCHLNQQLQNILQQQQQLQQEQEQEESNQLAHLHAQAWQQMAQQNEFHQQLQFMQRQMCQQQLDPFISGHNMLGNDDVGRSFATTTVSNYTHDTFQANDLDSQSCDQPESLSHHNHVVYTLPEPPISSSPNCFMLALDSDEKWLTPLHCFVRKYCVEAFIATSKDVSAPCMGKRNPLSVGQIGIRCSYCSPERIGTEGPAGHCHAQSCDNGVVYPSIISRIYNSSINLLQRHLHNCSHVPPEILKRYEELKRSHARSGASKKYWVDSAMKLGLIDTPHGIHLDMDVHMASMKEAVEKKKKKKNSPNIEVDASMKSSDSVEGVPLVMPSDKRSTTAFTFHLLSQMQPCAFTEADRLGRRRGLKIGFIGLACRHCFSVHGSGRFFPSSVKTMADASKSLDVMYRHIMNCQNCPGEIRTRLRNLRAIHDCEKNSMPFGNQRAFFAKVWHRLHHTKHSEPRSIPSSAVAILPKTTTPQSQPIMLHPHDTLMDMPAIAFELNQFATNAA